MATAKAIAIEDGRQLTRKSDVGQVSQFTLMRRRFMENRLSVFGGVVLILMYLMAAVAPFLAPYPFDALDSNYQFAAPTGIYVAGFRPVVCGTTQTLNKSTFTW